MNEFEKLALKIAADSPCEKRKVGAVIVNDKGIVLGEGFNYNTEPGPCECSRLGTYDSVVHAEVAAIESMAVQTGVPNLTMYCTYSPCTNCQKAIIKAGIAKVVIVEQFMKFDTDKLRYDLIPPSAMKALAKVLTYGAKKYKPNNWRSGDKDRYIAALYRHLEAWRAGEQNDEESGMTHLSHALTNVAFLLELDNGSK